MKYVALPRLFQPFHCESLARIGKDHDGGYLINSHDIDAARTLMSFGIGEDTSFEQMFLNENHIHAEAYDASIEQLNDSRIKHYREHVKTNNIDGILGKYRSIFLKCDIDGGEYDILYDLLRHSSKFVGAVIEFHGISNPHNFDELTNFISKFRLRLVHAHVNNYSYIITGENSYLPDVLELTFSGSLATFADKNLTLPHKLDMKNNPNDDEFSIVFNGDR
jgi:hypothetical protein